MPQARLPPGLYHAQRELPPVERRLAEPLLEFRQTCPLMRHPIYPNPPVCPSHGGSGLTVLKADVL
jgi:hypothetical protein